MNIIQCEHGCGQVATYQTKSSLKGGPFGGRPVWQCAKSHNSCPAVKKRKTESSIKKYGTEYPWQTQEIIEKRGQTQLTHCIVLHTSRSKTRRWRRYICQF